MFCFYFFESWVWKCPWVKDERAVSSRHWELWAARGPSEGHGAQSMAVGSYAGASVGCAELSKLDPGFPK